MHNAWSRANAVGTFFGTVAAVLCVLVALTDLVHSSAPAISLSTTEVKKLGVAKAGDADQAVLVIRMDADLTSAFSWNTKQLFVYLQAEYANADNAVNQVVLWDRIVRSKQAAVLRTSALRLKYPFIGRGHELRGAPYNLTLAWNVMPKVGLMRREARSFPQAPLPDEYTS